MKKSNALLSRPLLAGLLFSSMGWVWQAQAVESGGGVCYPTNGVKQYTFSFSPTLEDPDQNIAGKTIPNAENGNWNNQGGNYSLTCVCNGISETGEAVMNEAYISAYSPLSSLGISNSKGGEYYKLNDYLAVAAEVYVGGFTKSYFPVPFTNISNQYSNAQLPCTYNYVSGSQGHIDLYFIRPFVGISTIPLTKLVEVYISTKDGISSSTPAAEVYMSGTVTVPQSCDISPSSVIVDFGDIFSAQFKTAGAKPDNFEAVNKQLTVACRNISEGVKISLSFQGTADPTLSNALKSDNSDIAVRIEDANGTIISPNDGSLGVSFNYEAQQGTTEMNLYPVNTSGKAPQVGVFNSTATIKAEIQ